MDSDNEVVRGVDDLFVDYVDDDVVDEGVGKGKRIGRRSTVVSYEEGDHESSDDEGLQVADDDVEGQINLKFKNFSTEDMSDPSFKVGMVFELVEILRFGNPSWRLAPAALELESMRLRNWAIG